MTVLIDPTKEQDVEERILEDGVPLELGEMTKQVVLTKYISMDPQHADWQPAEEWFEEVTADVGGKGRSDRIQILDGGSGRRLSDDDGMIVKLRGTLSRIVGMVPGQPPMDERTVEDFIDATGRNVPRFQQWDFRITEVLLTNGPEGRRDMLRGEDQKRLRAQSEMFDKQTETFQKILDMFQAGLAATQAQGKLAPTAEEVLVAGKAAGAKKV